MLTLLVGALYHAASLGKALQAKEREEREARQAQARAVEHVLKHSGQPYQVRDYEPYGYDERQFCSPGIDLPMGCLMRTPGGEYPQYHTSADNLELLQPQSLQDSLDDCIVWSGNYNSAVTMNRDEQKQDAGLDASVVLPLTLSALIYSGRCRSVG